LGSLSGASASIPHDRDLILICASGHRSSQACSIFEQQGFTTVYNLAGGISGWKRAGLPLTR